MEHLLTRELANPALAAGNSLTCMLWPVTDGHHVICIDQGLPSVPCSAHRERHRGLEPE